MDFKPVPPSGKVVDLRKQNQACSSEDAQNEKIARQNKMRRNLRLFALVLAAYYFASAGYSYYQEQKLEQQAITTASIGNPLADPIKFRTHFNELLNQSDTSLPLANANDTVDGFIAVLSTAIEMQGYTKDKSKELFKVQIQTRYPDALPPESLKALQIFVLTTEQLINPQASQADADAILNQLGIIPKLDANENDKVFTPSTYVSLGFVYTTTFSSGPIDELTLIATPRVNLDSQDENYIAYPHSEDKADKNDTSEANLDSQNENNNNDVPEL